MKILVLNSEADAKRIYGDAIELAGADARYVDYQVGDPAGLLDTYNPDVILTSLEWLPQWRVIISLARSRKIPVVYVMDGIIEWSYIWKNQSYVIPDGTVLQPLLADYLCVIGNHPARILSSLGLADKINVIGLPRLDNIKRHKTSIAGEKPSVLVVTAKTHAHNKADELFVKQAISDLKQYLDNNERISSIWRINRQLAAEHNLPIQDPGVSLIDTIREVDCVISFPSTVLVESMLLNIPSCLIDYRTVPQYFNTAWTIRSKQHIVPVIHDMLYPEPEKIAYQNMCLEDEFSTGNASKKLADVIASAEFKGMKKTGDFANYGCIDYKRIHSQLSLFSMESSSDLQYELDGCFKYIDQQAEYIRNLHNNMNEIHNNLMKNIMYSICEKFSFIPGAKGLVRNVRNIKLKCNQTFE